jgi:hypothetical protein
VFSGFAQEQPIEIEGVVEVVNSKPTVEEIGSYIVKGMAWVVSEPGEIKKVKDKDELEKYIKEGALAILIDLGEGRFLGYAFDNKYKRYLPGNTNYKRLDVKPGTGFTEIINQAIHLLRPLFSLSLEIGVTRFKLPEDEFFVSGGRGEIEPKRVRGQTLQTTFVVKDLLFNLPYFFKGADLRLGLSYTWGWIDYDAEAYDDVTGYIGEDPDPPSLSYDLYKLQVGIGETFYPSPNITFRIFAGPLFSYIRSKKKDGSFITDRGDTVNYTAKWREFDILSFLEVRADFDVYRNFNAGLSVQIYPNGYTIGLTGGARF